MKSDDLMIDDSNISSKEDLVPQKELKFECPNCGTINQENVIFLCNKCDTKDMIYKDGFYLCPTCLQKKDNNFMCANCDSTAVELKSKF